MNLKTPPVIVVGAGLGGLATALLLARRHVQVAVYEGAKQPGGRARSPALGEQAVNLGAHALYLRSSAERVLLELGVTLPGWHPTGDILRLLAADGSVRRAPVTPGELLGSSHYSMKSRWEFVRRVMSLHREVPADENAEQWLERIDDLEVRALIATLGRVATYSNAPSIASGAWFAKQLRHSLDGVRYLDGGWQPLVDQLVTQCRAAGVTLHFERAVARVAADGRAVELASGEQIDASATVVATSLPVASRLIPSLASFASAAVPSRAATLDLVLSRLPNPSCRTVFALNAPLYFSVHTPPGQSGPFVAHAMYTLAPHEKGAATASALEAFVDTVQPGWRPYVVDRRFLPEMVALDAIPRVREVAPTPQVAERLFVTAEWVNGGVLLDGVLASASTVAPLVCNTLARSNLREAA